MVTIITNYTTYDQAYYYADLQRVVPLSEAAHAQLLATSLSTGPTAEQARQCLIAEGHSSQEHMNRSLRGDEYVCLNRRRQGNEQQLCFQQEGA